MANSEMIHCAPGRAWGRRPAKSCSSWLREKAVEEEVRNDQIVASGGLPLESVGMMQANAMAGLRAATANATIENPEHGFAGVDDIRGEGGIFCQQARQEASIPIAQKQRVARAGQMDKLSITAAPEPGAEAHVFQPSIGAGNAIEVRHRAKGKKANGVSRAASAAMRRCRGERCELRASRAKSSPLLRRAAR